MKPSDLQKVQKFVELNEEKLKFPIYQMRKIAQAFRISDTRLHTRTSPQHVVAPRKASRLSGNQEVT
jgi:hypothetical protein